MGISSTEAMIQINSLANPTVIQIKNIVAQVDATLSLGSTPYFYSGAVNGQNAYQIVQNIQSNSFGNNISYIDDTHVSQLLNNPDFELALRNAIANDPSNTLTFDQIMNGSQNGGNRVADGLWDVASGNLASNVSGDVNVIAPFGDANSVFS